MKTIFGSRRKTAYALFFAVSCVGYAACGGDNGGDTSTTGNPQPVGSSSSGGGSASTTTTTATGTGGAGGSTTTTTTTGTGGSGGCFSGTPSNDEQYLNACNGMTCNAFDNKGRLPLLNSDGSLPALP